MNGGKRKFLADAIQDFDEEQVPKVITNNSAAVSESLSWAEKYKPTSVAQLAVHKRKVADVREWILSCVDKETGILVLQGPSGSGKTATVETICGEVGIEIIEWINPIHLVNFSSIKLEILMIIYRSIRFK